MTQIKKWTPPKNRVGSLKKAKSGSLYIEVEQDMNFTTGDRLYLKTPQEDIDGLAQRGFITQDEAEVRKGKVPEYVRYVVDKGSSTKI